MTLVHEAGHAVVAVLTGRRLNAIRLHTDTSGLTLSTGKPRGPGMMATAAAGYLAPAALGLGSVALVQADETDIALYAGLAVLALMLLFIRNWFGLLVVGITGAAVAALVWKADQQRPGLRRADVRLVPADRRTAHGSRPLVAPPSQRTRTSDADILARLTHLPAAVWNLLFLLLTGAALGTAVWLVG